MDPPALPSASAQQASPSCGDGETRCRDETSFDRCVGNEWQSQPCGELGCVAGGCPNEGSGSTMVRAERLMRPVGPGWTNAWTSYGPLPEQALEDLVAEGAFGGDPSQRELVCAPDGYVAVDPTAAATAASRHHLLTGLMIVGAEQDAVLRLSAQGRVRVWLHGALVIERDTPSVERPFADELLVPVKLVAGVNPVLVAVTQSRPTPTGFWLRFGRADGSLLDYRWAASHDRACSLGALTQVGLRAKLAEPGFSPRLDLRLSGLVPAAQHQLVVKLVVPAPQPGLGAKDRATDTVLAEQRFTREALVEGASLEARLELSKPKTVALRAELMGSESSERRWQLRYRGEDTDRLARLAGRYLDGDRAKLPEWLAEDSRASFEHALRTMVTAAEEGHHDSSWLRKGTSELEELARAIEASRDPYEGKTGILHRAYRSTLDGKLQPYIVHVPPRSKTAKQPLPLVVISHGLHNDPALALRILIGAGPSETEDRAFATRHLPAFPDFGAVLVAPGGYRDAGQRTIGEQDVVDVIAHVRKLYRIDERRISITGYSLGGTVSFTLPLHYPSLFSAAAPLCGYPNLTSYSEVARTPKQPFEEVMLQRRFIGNYVENGKYLPLHIVHGGKDGPHRSAVIADRYRALGYPRIFEIEQDLGHNVWDKAYEDGKMVAWLRRHRRPERPDHVRLRTGELRYDRSYWLRLIAFSSEQTLAYLDARYLGKQKRFEIKTDGARAFAIDVSGFDATEAVIDGKTVAIEPGSGERFFVLGDEGFEARKDEPDRKGHKRPGLAGPIDDVLRHPLVIVYGTQLAAELEANRMTAEHYSSYDSWAGASYPIVADRVLKDEMLTGRSIVLVGGPKSNALTARLAPGLPVSFEDDALSFRGVRYRGADVGISMIRPSPLDPDQYLVLHAGVGYAGTLASRHLPRLTPDFAVYDGRLRAATGGELLGARQVLTAGFFSDDWN